MSNPAFSDIGACVFDAYGTLFDVHSAAGHEAAALGEKGKALSASWRQKQLEYTWLRSLMGRHADFWQVTGDALDYAMALHGVADPALRERLMQLYRRLDAYPDVRPSLERLRAGGLKTAILSNGEPSMLQDAVAHAGIADLLDDVQSIESVGIFKPDMRVYQLSVDRLGLAAGRICFVSTNAWDASGAGYFGFRVAWMNRFGMPDERLGNSPAAVIEGLDELPGLLGL
ncbi:2-haloacid dehalogenase [Tistlia consotensis]|uniref:(S)-2-haloacid dehalogenase n=1 Tax=Tistlia consotensis USBA 355 TaxID=560819 RepID=A0A1Y6BU49_9PROT|nr:haloacid dehalogenase type II [Tistlia consotensis]SMF18442.1 2-haloacid dehalogenase [Tistlia consotensis USBA 355]SNR39686.1 2-haloacid dehalogenase [Tistlia consotensis]